jgi:hypothetical protein
VNDESIYDFRIIPSLTTSNIRRHFSLLDTYRLTVLYNGLLLKNKSRRSDVHFFSAKYFKNRFSDSDHKLSVIATGEKKYFNLNRATKCPFSHQIYAMA